MQGVSNASDRISSRCSQLGMLKDNDLTCFPNRVSGADLVLRCSESQESNCLHDEGGEDGPA